MDAEKKYTMTISMTTHGARVPLIDRVLAPTLQRAKKVGARVALTLYKDDVDRLLPSTAEILNDPDACLLVAEEDYGSNLKYLAAMKRFPNEPVMVQDDDVTFPDNVYVEMLKFNESHPSSIGCRRCRCMCWDDDMVPHKFPRGYEILSADTVGYTCHVKDSFAEGCKGIIFPAGCFSKLIDNAGMLSDIKNFCFHDDDIAIRLLTLRSGLHTYIVKTNGPLVDVDWYASTKDPNYINDPVIRETSLWREGRGGMRTTECLRHFAQELWAYGRNR